VGRESEIGRVNREAFHLKKAGDEVQNSNATGAGDVDLLYKMGRVVKGK
jgi:hypothetical protein